MLLYQIWNFFFFYKTALMIACENNFLEGVKLILENKNVDINATDVLFSWMTLEFIYLFYECFINRM